MDISCIVVPFIAVVLLSTQVVVWGKENTAKHSSGTGADNSRKTEAGQSDTGTADREEKDGAGAGKKDSGKELEMFQRIFLQKRSQQHSAIQDIFDKYNHEQQFKLIDLLLDKMQEILTESKQTLTGSGFQPGMPFPTHQAIKDSLSLLLENLAFLGDIVLRLPDITHSLYSKKKELREVVRWAVTYAEQTGFYDDTHKKLMNLMSQELRLIKRDPDYVNPFKREEVAEPTPPKKKKEKKPKKKGPRISRGEL
ncbi:coiled-coil domain-containing protein 134-like [Acanthaster planci]|uniref:Coiled-coil domain-containing protein 134-like n=1 Tax=Acanthaster planci TaxID=133434 RepID=A0A8B7XX65_ACAPL|nr:coiled-coil domain-containing protein 134-like [Acanthaster planci]